MNTANSGHHDSVLAEKIALKSVFDAGLNGTWHPDLNSAGTINDVGLIGQVFGSDE